MARSLAISLLQLRLMCPSEAPPTSLCLFLLSSLCQTRLYRLCKRFNISLISFGARPSLHTALESLLLCGPLHRCFLCFTLGARSTAKVSFKASSSILGVPFSKICFMISEQNRRENLAAVRHADFIACSPELSLLDQFLLLNLSRSPLLTCLRFACFSAIRVSFSSLLSEM